MERDEAIIDEVADYWRDSLGGLSVSEIGALCLAVTIMAELLRLGATTHAMAGLSERILTEAIKKAQEAKGAV